MPLPEFPGFENPFQTRPLGMTQADLFRGKPEEAFFSAIPQGLPRGAETQYRNLVRTAVTDFITGLGRQIRAGNMPTLQESEFFGSYPFQEKLAAMSPQEKGLGVARFNPFARWQF